MSCDLESFKFIKSLKVGKVGFDFVIAFLRPKKRSTMLLFLLNSQQFCMQSLVLTLPPHNLQMWFVSDQRFNETSFAHYIKDLTTVKSSVWQNVARVLSLETLIILEPQVLQMSHASIKDHKSKPFYLWKVGYIRLFIRLSKLRLPAPAPGVRISISDILWNR